MHDRAFRESESKKLKSLIEKLKEKGCNFDIISNY